MLNPEECKALIQFLDRAAITGHGERQAMNTVVQKIALMSQAALAAQKAAEKEQDKVANTSTDGNDEIKTSVTPLNPTTAAAASAAATASD